MQREKSRRLLEVTPKTNLGLFRLNSEALPWEAWLLTRWTDDILLAFETRRLGKEWWSGAGTMELILNVNQAV